MSKCKGGENFYYKRQILKLWDKFKVQKETLNLWSDEKSPRWLAELIVSYLVYPDATH